MTDLDVLVLVVWGGGLFNVGFLAGWFACRRILRRSGEASEVAPTARRPGSTLAPGLLMSANEAVRTDGKDPPGFGQLLREESAVRERAE